MKLLSDGIRVCSRFRSLFLPGSGVSSLCLSFLLPIHTDPIHKCVSSVTFVSIQRTRVAKVLCGNKSKRAFVQRLVHTLSDGSIFRDWHSVSLSFLSLTEVTLYHYKCREQYRSCVREGKFTFCLSFFIIGQNERLELILCILLLRQTDFWRNPLGTQDPGVESWRKRRGTNEANTPNDLGTMGLVHPSPQQQEMR